jgi:hypothetical protein
MFQVRGLTSQTDCAVPWFRAHSVPT